MDMPTRLELLRNLVQADLESLPDRPVTPISDDNSGGVSLAPSGSSPSTSKSKQPTLEPTRQDPDTNTPIVPTKNTEKRIVWLQGVASSHDSGASPKPANFSTTKLPPAKLCKGGLALARDCFTPIYALSKYPYRFCDKKYMQDIATNFFDAGKFWEREWDLYYVWDTEKNKPILLIHENQFQGLLKEINSVLKLNLKITDQQREEGLVARFPDHPLCIPRYLGRSNTRKEVDTMADQAPPYGFSASSEPAHPPIDGRTLEDFKEMLEEMWELQKNKNKAAKAKKQQDRVTKQQNMNKLFKRAQRYLGLRPTATVSENGKSTELVSKILLPVDVSLPAPHPFDMSVVFVSVDVESYERAHSKITEVGVATLDTRDLVDIAPGEDGKNWMSKIRARHFRIRQHMHLHNSEFVQGCADRFEFGTSEIVDLDEAPAIVKACFTAPFCALAPADTEGTQESIIKTVENMNLNEERNLIFLGHDHVGDIRYLQNLGFNPLDMPNLKEAVDTANLYRVWRREQNPTTLGKVLYDFDIIGWNLHNAGNDAVYTAQVMLAILVREASIRGTGQKEAMHRDDQAVRLATLTAEAVQKAQDDAEGWSDTEHHNDGGQPEPIILKEREPKEHKGYINPTSPQNGTSRGDQARDSRTVEPRKVESYPTLAKDSHHCNRGRGQRTGFSARGRGYCDATGDIYSGIGNHGRSQRRGRGRGRGSFSSYDGAGDKPVYSPGGRGRGHSGGRARARPHTSYTNGSARNNGNGVLSNIERHPMVCYDLIDLEPNSEAYSDVW
ncbi:hypothetical protein CC78DRAFT_575474 [Lojkania enalia]|uniref:Gfd2/YDR514C-like C-terminal domain-containing protein n=1 Tax=Lojkania enalia TaxID=147567 RepID=A0A9P4N999_9PLEO|nr:hypothetical protein CC78DRAFT_575474 [Didymosphaeria enalia]